ncbi:MAG: hypothetical protein K8R54_13065 [Bacteroidales bacterium]|nr:hypothetical protein [Bacteroidales bacterium]
MIVRIYIIISLFILISSENFAQTDSIRVDTESDTLIILEEDIIESENTNKKKPARAFLYSAVLPGLGQAYNTKYWKIPVVYSALGGVAFLFNYNNKQYNRFLDGYKELREHEIDSTSQITIFTDNPEIETIKQYKDKFRRNRDLSALIFIVVYVLNFIDATVDAHLYDFDISDDLSFKIRPEVLPIYTLKNSNTIGLTFSFKF